MGKCSKLQWTRYRLISLALSVAVKDLDEDILLVTGLRRRSPQYWMGPYLRERTDFTQRNTLAKLEMDFIRLGCVSEFFRTTRMAPSVHRELLELVRPLITRADTNFRPAITAEERLSITIRYLARGDSVGTLHQAYLVGESTVLPIVRDTCRAIYSVLQEKYLKTPTCEADWKKISKEFHDKWNFPHVLGAIDGKHCRIKCPRKSGSLFYNYKNFFSIVLLAVVDANYRFIYVDVGAEGKASDSSLWELSAFNRDINRADNPLGIPPADHLPGFQGELNYFFVGDDAFSLGERLMKPFPSQRLTMAQRIYNYRLSRTRRIVENAFGIMSTRFRILRREIDMEPEGARDVVLACVALHNFLTEKAMHAYIPKPSADWEGRDYRIHKGIWRKEVELEGRDKKKSKKNHSLFVKNMRERLMYWCLTKEGEVEWQYELVLSDLFYD